MSSSNLSLLTSFGVLGVYACAFYSLNSPEVWKGFEAAFSEKLHPYGLFVFFTNQCLAIQLVSAILHVVALFVEPLRTARDLVFTTLAFPVGSIVVYTFWLVWFGMGREFIFPAELDAYYPQWLHCITHLAIVPINFLLIPVIKYEYFKNGLLITLIYMTAYMIHLHVVKVQTGLFVYGYLNKFNDIERMVYFAATGLSAILMYKLGSFLTTMARGSEQVAPSRTPAKDQK